MLSSKPPKKLIKNTKDIEKVIQMMKKHTVDEIQIDGITIKITKHLAEITDKKTKDDLKPTFDDVLFHSAI